MSKQLRSIAREVKKNPHLRHTALKTIEFRNAKTPIRKFVRLRKG